MSALHQAPMKADDEKLSGLLSELYLTIEDHRAKCEPCERGFGALHQAHLLTPRQIHTRRTQMCPLGGRLMDSLGKTAAELSRRML